jgi:hypothetical protein|tara:strand:- start:342 stop:485 length:144 start_codon:yes stop_codon:yes gene_type:complete
MAKRGITHAVLERKKVRRPGVHAKTKTSGLKSSKYYKKKYRGQGKKR